MDDSTLTLRQAVDKPQLANGDDLPECSANDMRRLAEKADGWRKNGPTLVQTAEGVIDVVEFEHIKNEKPLARITTNDTGDGLSRIVKIRLVVESSGFGDAEPSLVSVDIQEADAVFVTQSSVSKFLFPYYLRFKEPKEIEEMETEIFGDGTVVGVIHLPGSSYKADRAEVVTIDKAGRSKTKTIMLGR